METIPLTKSCRACGQTKPLDEFHKKSASADGHGTKCKVCACTQSLAHYYRDHESSLAKGRAKYVRNGDAMRATNKRWREKNPERRLDYMRRWYASNVERRLRIAHRRNERLIAGGPIYSWDAWIALRESYGDRCLACGATDTLLVPDHVIPLEKGGSNAITNIQPLCKRCNQSKRNKTIDYRP